MTDQEMRKTLFDCLEEFYGEIRIKAFYFSPTSMLPLRKPSRSKVM